MDGHQQHISNQLEMHLQVVLTPFPKSTLKYARTSTGFAKKILSPPLFALLTDYFSSTASLTGSNTYRATSLANFSSVTFAVNLALTVSHKTAFMISPIDSARR